MATSRTKLTPARLGHRKTKWAAVSCAHALPAEVFQTYFEGLIIVYYTSLSSLVLSSSIILRASWIMLLSMVRDFADWIKVCWNSKNKWQKWEFNVQTSFSWCELSQASPDIHINQILVRNEKRALYMYHIVHSPLFSWILFEAREKWMRLWKRCAGGRGAGGESPSLVHWSKLSP